MNCNGVLAYLDDILTFWEVEEHLNLIQCVLQGHRDSGILLKAAKTRFFQRYVEYLGYGVTAEGVHLTEKAFELIRSWPVPQLELSWHQSWGSWGITGSRWRSCQAEE